MQASRGSCDGLREGKLNGTGENPELSTALREALEPLLQEVESLNERIQEYDRRIERWPSRRIRKRRCSNK